MVPTESAPILTTTAPSEDVVAKVEEAAPDAVVAVMPKPEKEMVTRNVQQLALKLLDSNMTNTELSWQQDGQQYSARVMRQPALDSTGIEQVIAEVMTSKNGKRMKTRLSLKRLAFSHFTQLVNHWDRNIMLHDDVIDGRFHSNTEFAFSTTKDVAAAVLRQGDHGRIARSRSTVSIGVATRTCSRAATRPRPIRVNLPQGHARCRERRRGRRPPRVHRRHAHHLQRGWQLRLAQRERRRPAATRRTEPARALSRSATRAPSSTCAAPSSGMFTVFTPNDIEIEDDLVYAKDPRQTVLSRDFLALISGRDICIAAPRSHRTWRPAPCTARSSRAAGSTSNSRTAAAGTPRSSSTAA